jgi:hypothetical protein
VGAALQVTESPGDSFTTATVEFKVIGTAVRAGGCPPPARPFTAELSGPDFAKLLVTGWVPAGIALGISGAGLHDDLPTTSSGPWGTGNAEVPAYTDFIVQVSQDAWNRLERAVRELGADGIVVSATTLHVRSSACRARLRSTDHFAEPVICRHRRGAIRRPAQGRPGTEPCCHVARNEWRQSRALTAGAPKPAYGPGQQLGLGRMERS